jgi:hypothetical protein
MKMKNFTNLMAAGLLLGLPGAVQFAAADQQVVAAFSLATRAKLIVNSSGCNNSGGPQVTLAGEIALGDLTARVTLSNNTKGTHTTTVTDEMDFSLLLGDSITLPKQPVRGGVGGNPHIWLQFHDGRGNNQSGEIYLGRCVQGLQVSAELVNAAIALAEIGGDGCSNHPGPTITLGGTITLSGLHARLIFRNNVKGTHTAEAIRDVTLIGEGDQVTVPKQPSQGGVGGNPLINVQFLDENGDPIANPVSLGRCTQL